MLSFAKKYWDSAVEKQRAKISNEFSFRTSNANGILFNLNRERIARSPVVRDAGRHALEEMHQPIIPTRTIR